MARDLAANLPETIRLNFPVHPCGTSTDAGTPDRWDEEAALVESGLSGVGVGVPFTLSIVDTCPAIYSVNPADPEGSPKNVDHLVALTKRVARDTWEWRTVAYDRVYAGIVAPDLEGISDEVEWSYREDDCSTRLTTAGPDLVVRHMNHADADDCASGVGVYLTSPAATVTGTASRSLKIRKGKVKLVRGRLVVEQDGDDTITLC